MTKLSDTHYLKRASRYANALNGNDRLPVVYGDCSGAGDSVWPMPCIDTVNNVYCYAAHPVLTVAQGNVVSIRKWEDGVLCDPSEYTFNPSDNYESLGNIATVTMAISQGRTIVSASGMGKATGGVLMENIIDILNDFLTVESDFTSALYDATSKARASQIFSAQAYKAAGVINQDMVIWDIIREMMGSFLGSAYVNGPGKLVLDIDDNTIPGGVEADIIPRATGVLTAARIRRDNIINQCPASYAYNYVAGEFKRHTDDTAHADAISQGVFGVRRPTTPYQFYWCRDLTSVQAIQDLIVAKLKNPLYEIEITDMAVGRCGVDAGDIVAYSADRLYDSDGSALLNQFWKVLSEKPNHQKNQIVFRALQTNYFMTTAKLLDGSFILDGSEKFGGQRDTTVY